MTGIYSLKLFRAISFLNTTDYWSSSVVVTHSGGWWRMRVTRPWTSFSNCWLCCAALTGEGLRDEICECVVTAEQ